MCKYMEYYQHKDGLWYVVRYRDDWTPSTTPWGWKTKSAAIHYIEAHGLIPHERKPA